MFYEHHDGKKQKKHRRFHFYPRFMRDLNKGGKEILSLGKVFHSVLVFMRK